MLSDYDFPDDDANYSDENFENSSPQPKGNQQAVKKNAPVLGADKDFLNQSGFESLPIDESYGDGVDANKFHKIGDGINSATNNQFTAEESKQ